MSSKLWHMNNGQLSKKSRNAIRSLFVRLVSAVCGIALCGVAPQMGWAQSVGEIFSRLDQAAQSFSGVTANIRAITHTGIINEDETQIGTLVVKRHPLRFLINFTGPDAQGIALTGQTIQIYYPKLNTVREYNIGKYKDLAQKLILLSDLACLDVNSQLTTTLATLEVSVLNRKTQCICSSRQNRRTS